MRRPGIPAPSRETLLAALLIVEGAVFSVTGHGFASLDNVLGLVRLACEGGLLALALAPVVLAGGIDLSLGSLLGLSSVVLGLLWRDAGWPWPWAAAGAVACGALGGLVNAVAVARLRANPLIVTLGTQSLFRGLAEALTRGVDTVTGFPAAFLSLGQGALAGGVPVQAPLLAAALAGLWLLVHRHRCGREWRAVGFSAEGALHAGVPVGRRRLQAHLLAGVAAGVAAVVQVSRVGQAKADAGTGMELLAVTAVVLGGTHLSGGRGSIAGTFLGFAVLAVLRNGLQLSDQPAELAGILTGVVLLGVLVLGARRDGQRG